MACELLVTYISIYATTYGALLIHYDDVIMGVMASQITSLTIVYSAVYSGTDQRKHQNSASLAFVRGIHRGTVNSPHKWPVTRIMFPFDDVIMSKPVWKYRLISGADMSYPPFMYRGATHYLRRTVEWRRCECMIHHSHVGKHGLNYHSSCIRFVSLILVASLLSKWKMGRISNEM